MKILKNLPFQLFLSVLIAVFIANLMSNFYLDLFYSISCVIKEALIMVLPVIIFAYLTSALVSFEKNAPLLVLGIVFLVICSNAATVLTGYAVGKIFLSHITQNTSQILATKQAVNCLWGWHIPSFISASNAMLAGISVGILGSFLQLEQLKNGINKVRDYVDIFLKKIFLPFLPLYVFGFLVKMQKEGTLANLFANYTKVFILIFFLVISYIIFFYLLSANFNFKKALSYFKEMIPAGITAFSTMSSVATMPVTLSATEKNINSKKMASLIVPTTVNIHLMADGLSISVTALALMLMANQGIPEISSYIWFVVYYCVAKFSCAGVPGGGVIVLIPVFQEHLHMNLEIATLLTTIYILQDSFLTCGNVMGNGAFAVFTDNFLQKIKFYKR